MNHLHLNLRFKKSRNSHNSNTAGLSSETPGWVSLMLDQETHSQHFSASDLPLISELPSSPASPRAKRGKDSSSDPPRRGRKSLTPQTPIPFIRN